MAINATFNAIINAPITAKKKNAEGKYEQYTTTALSGNFSHAPKAKDCENSSAQSALNALSKVYEYMEIAATARTDNQRNKAMGKAHDFTKTYLRAVGLDDGIGNMAMITALFAPKRQTKTDRNTKEKTILGGYTTCSTFVKYALYLTNHILNGGAWCDAKTTAKAKKDENAELWAQMERNKKALQAEQERTQIMSVLIAQSPELQAQLQEMLAKLSA